MAAPPSPSPAPTAAPDRPSSAPSSPSVASPASQQRQLGVSKIERLYIHVANVMDHAKELAKSLPPRTCDDGEVDDEDITAWCIEANTLLTVFMLEYSHITGKSLSTCGLNIFLRENQAQALKEAQEKAGRELTEAEQEGIRQELQDLYEQQRKAKRTAIERKKMEQILREKLDKSREKRTSKNRAL